MKSDFFARGAVVFEEVLDMWRGGAFNNCSLYILKFTGYF